MSERPIITLLTDLGTTDAFVGMVKGVVLARNRDAQIVDLTQQFRSCDLLGTEMQESLATLGSAQAKSRQALEKCSTAVE